MEYIVCYSSQEEGHTGPHRATWGEHQEAGRWWGETWTEDLIVDFTGTKGKVG